MHIYNNLIFLLSVCILNKKKPKKPHYFIRLKSSEILPKTNFIDLLFKKPKRGCLKGIKLFKIKETLRILKKGKRLRKIWLFFNTFLLNFLEFFLKKRVLFHFRKCSKKINLKTMSLRKFNNKFFKKRFRVPKQILGILYYALLLKDSSIFISFIKRILEKINIKLHKKFFLSLKKIIQGIYKPIFKGLGLKGLFLNVKGKLGVSGNAKKRRYFFYFGRHSLTSRRLRVDLKATQIRTFTGVLGLTFYLFF